MDEGVSRYFKDLFDIRLGAVAGGWAGSKKMKLDSEKKHILKEEFVSILEEDEVIKTIVNEFELNSMLRVLRLDEVRAKDIMVPRTSAFAVDINDDITEILDGIIEERYSRVPVYDKDIDNIIGVIHVKDLFAQTRKGNLELINLRGILRKAYFVHEFKPVDRLLREMQRDRTHMGLVIDEYGGFSGLLTIEDILEEIVGDIDDEDDEPEVDIEIQKISGTTYKIDGLTSVSDVNDELDLDLPLDITETMGALLLGHLGRIPHSDKDRNSVLIGNVELKAVKVSDKRIENLLLKIVSKKEQD